MPAERRAYRRVPTSLDVLWNGMLTDNYARATDVSLGGCYVESAGRVGVGEPVTVVMMVTPRTHLLLRGEVAHGEWPPGFGLRFLGLPGEARAAILRLVERSA